MRDWEQDSQIRKLLYEGRTLVGWYANIQTILCKSFRNRVVDRKQSRLLAGLPDLLGPPRASLLFRASEASLTQSLRFRAGSVHASALSSRCSQHGLSGTILLTRRTALPHLTGRSKGPPSGTSLWTHLTKLATAPLCPTSVTASSPPSQTAPHCWLPTPGLIQLL